MTDEFGGIPVNTSKKTDEFGGVLVDSSQPSVTKPIAPIQRSKDILPGADTASPTHTGGTPAPPEKPRDQQNMFERFADNMNITNPLEMISHPSDTINSIMQNNYKHNGESHRALAKGDYGHAAMEAIRGFPVAGPIIGGIKDELSQGHVGQAVGDIAPFLLPGLHKAAESPMGQAAKAAVKGGLAEGARPVTYGMHKLPLPASVAGAMGGHFAASPWGPTAAKIGSVVGGVAPMVKGAYNAGKQAYKGATTLETPLDPAIQTIQDTARKSAGHGGVERVTSSDPELPSSPAPSLPSGRQVGGPHNIPQPVVPPTKPPRVSLPDLFGTKPSPVQVPGRVEPIRPASASARALTPSPEPAPPHTPLWTRDPLPVRRNPSIKPIKPENGILPSGRQVPGPNKVPLGEPSPEPVPTRTPLWMGKTTGQAPAPPPAIEPIKPPATVVKEVGPFKGGYKPPATKKAESAKVETAGSKNPDYAIDKTKQKVINPEGPFAQKALANPELAKTAIDLKNAIQPEGSLKKASRKKK
jgi:hypothetical protein